MGLFEWAEMIGWLLFIIASIISTIYSAYRRKEHKHLMEIRAKEEIENKSNIEKELEKDESFHIKNNKIIKLITEDKLRDIKEIAEKSGCTLEECFLKIKYLEEKKRIPNIHLNSRAYTLIECSPGDEILLEKYTPYLNNRKIEAHRLNEFRYEEILYLYKKDLIPEIDIDEETKTIIFLDLHRKDDLITVVCGNCGSINDVNRGSKTKCKYCKSIINIVNKK